VKDQIAVNGEGGGLPRLREVGEEGDVAGKEVVGVAGEVEVDALVDLVCIKRFWRRKCQCPVARAADAIVDLVCFNRERKSRSAKAGLSNVLPASPFASS
jgi:hypothetical protein